MRKTPSRARLVLLVTAAVFINYIDRGNLATAAPLMQDELRLSASQLGVLLSAFYYGYVICMPAMGWLAERYGAKRVLAAGVATWSVATLTTGFAGSFVTLLGLRVLLGIGESVAFPCASKVLAHAVEVSRLGVANGILSFGYLLGPAVGTFGLTRELARGLAPAVRVNGISPGYVNSNWECSFGDMNAAAKATVPLARVGQTEDYAEVIVYLCAGASYITGEIVPVTGGTRI